MAKTIAGPILTGGPALAAFPPVPASPTSLAPTSLAPAAPAPAARGCDRDGHRAQLPGHPAAPIVVDDGR